MNEATGEESLGCPAMRVSYQMEFQSSASQLPPSQRICDSWLPWGTEGVDTCTYVTASMFVSSVLIRSLLWGQTPGERKNSTALGLPPS